MTESLRPEPAFEAPWHAQLFALSVHLNEAGHFDWAEWAAQFGATLARHGQEKSLNGGDDYFHAWLETLERLLADRAMADPDQVAALRDAWERAFLDTPHGQSVHLKG